MFILLCLFGCNQRLRSAHGCPHRLRTGPNRHHVRPATAMTRSCRFANAPPPYDLSGALSLRTCDGIVPDPAPTQVFPKLFLLFLTESFPKFLILCQFQLFLPDLSLFYFPLFNHFILMILSLLFFFVIL